MTRAKFSATIHIEIEYDEDVFETPSDACYYFLQESDYEFKYPNSESIRVFKTEITDQKEPYQVSPGKKS